MAGHDRAARADVSPWRDAHGIAAYLDFDVKTIHRMTGPRVTDGIPYHRFTPNGRKMFYVPEVDEWGRRQ